MEPRWLTVKAAADYLSVRPATIYEWAGDGTLPGVVRIARRHPGGQGRHRVTIRIDKMALDEFLKRRAR
jgi:excisionase family DNA binding protein